MQWELLPMCFGEASFVGPFITSHFNSFLWNHLAKMDTYLFEASIFNKKCSFYPDGPATMATVANSCFWLDEIIKIFYSETIRPNELKLGGNISVWSFIMSPAASTFGFWTLTQVSVIRLTSNFKTSLRWIKYWSSWNLRYTSCIVFGKIFVLFF